MWVLRIAVIAALLPFTRLSAQFSLESFLAEPFNNTINSIKERLHDKDLEEKEIKNYKAVMYYDWLEPISIKAAYIFTTEGLQNGKMISNGKENVGDAINFFNISKAVLIKMYGSNYSENNILGVKMLSWSDVEGCSVMLVIKGSKTMLTVMKI